MIRLPLLSRPGKTVLLASEFGERDYEMTKIPISSLVPPKHSPKTWLKRFPFLIFAKRHIWDFRALFLHGKSPAELISSLPLFAPGSKTSPKDRAAFALQCANQIFPSLVILLRKLGKAGLIMTDVPAFRVDDGGLRAAAELKFHLDKCGSDKANIHNYHLIYGPILQHREKITAILEIGVGTNNTRIPSNMGLSGRPGASLRAFRDFLPTAMVYGADIDEDIFFEETRIKVFYVDQTKFVTFENLEKNLGDTAFDLIIDDGLHAPNANLAVLIFALNRLKIGGWLVIEDVVESASPFWEVVASLLPQSYKTYLIRADNGFVFAVEKRTV